MGFSTCFHCLLVGLLLKVGAGFALGQSTLQTSTSVGDNAIRLWRIQLETFVAIAGAHLQDISYLRQQPDWLALAQRLAYRPGPHEAAAHAWEMRQPRISPHYHVLALQSEALITYGDDLLRRYRQHASRLQVLLLILGTQSAEVAGASSKAFRTLEQFEASLRERLSAYDLST